MEVTGNNMVKLNDITDVVKKICIYWDDTNDLLDKNHPLNNVIDQYKEINKGYEISLIDKLEIKNFLKDNYTLLYELYDRFNIYGVRSDISRLVHLYLYGGFYCDTHVKILQPLEYVEICDHLTGFNKNTLSFINISSVDCREVKPSLGVLYSNGNDSLYLKCLSIAQTKIQEIINKQKHTAGLYTKDIHVACANGLYGYVNIDGKTVDPSKDKTILYNYFRHILKFGGDPKVFSGYSSNIMSSNNTRAGNKHWSILCQELDLFN